jgi:hypothetical protein
MKTAYLILAHQQPDHIAKLVQVLNGPECAFFIHIDAKVDEAVFRAPIEEKRNLVFVERRFSVNWGGFGPVAATLELLSAAFAWTPPFGRFCLLSGSDFPIQPNSRIRAEFESSKEFMRVDRKLDPGIEGSHNHFIRFYWFTDSADERLKSLSGKLKRKLRTRIGLYHGSQWWALTRDCVEYVLRFVASNSEYETFLKLAHCPDEIFFHSILKQSPFANRITHDFETASNQIEYFLSNEHGCHYIDWNAEAAPLPKVLELEDLDKLLQCQCLFARKFDERRSAALIARFADSLTFTAAPRFDGR